ncbi:MAG: DUF1566 domain-containing protein [Firmicutes bacterium]|nr:DUF1566 domain-containing protein [Bacillota bacterium]
MKRAYFLWMVCMVIAVFTFSLWGCSGGGGSSNTPGESPTAPPSVSPDATLTQTPVPSPSLTSSPAGSGYVVTDTNQNIYYGNSTQISKPGEGQDFYGQDAQYSGVKPSWKISSDGKTVYDANTGLTWVKSPDTNGDGVIDSDDKLTAVQAKSLPDSLNSLKFGGYSDWRLPSIKELYSLIVFSGIDPSGLSGSDVSGLIPFIDDDFFDFAYGDTGAGERIIDSQYISSTYYISGNGNKVFGVNFADGRIKGYDSVLPGGKTKTFLVLCVRSSSDYGKNSFVNNGNGTITDKSTGLMWTVNDSGTGMNWKSALAWVQAKNAENYLGFSDWRLPNAKELQSIVDYSRSPDATGTAAIDAVFNCSKITNEAGEDDYPYFWTSTTHVNTSSSSGAWAVYVAFGRGLGFIDGAWTDIHGAGCQRSDPKEGEPSDWPNGHGPQGDAVRILNFVRLVRNAY